MTTKKLKYQELLSQFPNCPSDNYVEIQMNAFRWVHSDEQPNDFKPINLINEPPQRLLDDADLMCMGYGLSLFDSLENAYSQYKRAYVRTRENAKSIFVNDKGSFIATLQLNYADGVGNEAHKNNHGHFTFYEYENVNLREKVKAISNIFDPNGKFIN